MGEERVFFEVVDLDQPATHRFAVIAIYPDRRAGGGCMGVVQSLHHVRESAENEVAASRAKAEQQP